MLVLLMGISFPHQRVQADDCQTCTSNDCTFCKGSGGDVCLCSSSAAWYQNCNDVSSGSYGLDSNMDCRFGSSNGEHIATIIAVVSLIFVFCLCCYCAQMQEAESAPHPGLPSNQKPAYIGCGETNEWSSTAIMPFGETANSTAVAAAVADFAYCPAYQPVAEAAQNDVSVVNGGLRFKFQATLARGQRLKNPVPVLPMP